MLRARLALSGVLAIALAGIAGTAPVTGATASPVVAPQTRDEVCEAAKAEGRLVYWNDFSTADAIVAAFQEKYPEIQVEVLRINDEDETQRILTEHAAGRPPTPDLVYIGLPLAQPLVEAGLIDTSVPWEGLGVPAELVAADTGGVRISRTFLSIVFDGRRFSSADMPDTWEEVLDPMWSGKVVVDPRGRPLPHLALLWGEEAVYDYTERLMAIDPVIIEGGTAGMVGVANGEADFTIGGRSDSIGELRDQGIELEIKYLDAIPTDEPYNVVMTGSQHPNAAKCFTVWMALEAAELIAEGEYKTNTSYPPGVAESIPILRPTNADEAALVEEASRRVSEIITGS
jgi:ABC-type Fe3+ transport system substrate-binding protein